MDLTPWLDDLEARIDPAVEDALLAQWQTFVAGKWTATDVFSPRRPAPSLPRVTWPAVRVNATLVDDDQMALQQLAGCSAQLAAGGGMLLAVRCNYGTGIMPSLFGAELFVMPEETDTLPTTRPIPGGLAAMAQVVARGVPDLQAGQGRDVWRMARHFQRLLAPYPRLRRYVHLYHPDLQGPMDVCELLWGSGLFTELVDEPAAVHELLALITATYTRFMQAWWQLVTPSADTAVHWGMLQPGRLMLRDDSAMNVSAAMFAEFIAPYDAQLLTTLGGGAMHFCGRGDHYLPHALACPQLRAINLSQPHLNDMEAIYRLTVDRDRLILDLPREAVAAARVAGRPLHGRVSAR